MEPERPGRPRRLYQTLPGLCIGRGRASVQPKPAPRPALATGAGSDRMMTTTKTAAALAVTLRPDWHLQGSPRPAENPGDRHRRPRRRLLPARRRHGQRAVEARAQCGGLRGNHRRLGGQSEADRHRPERTSAFTMADAADALHGDDKFRGFKAPLRTLLVVHPNRMHVVTIEGTGIDTHGGPEGQARLHRLAGQRHRSDGVSCASRRWVSTRTRTSGASGSTWSSWSTPSATARSTRSSGPAAFPPPRWPIWRRRQASR